jgi:hypothetical protein
METINLDRDAEVIPSAGTSLRRVVMDHPDSSDYIL